MNNKKALFLNIPFKEKDSAKEYFKSIKKPIKWAPDMKSWYVLLSTRTKDLSFIKNYASEDAKKGFLADALDDRMFSLKIRKKLRAYSIQRKIVKTWKKGGDFYFSLKSGATFKCSGFKDIESFKVKEGTYTHYKGHDGGGIVGGVFMGYAIFTNKYDGKALNIKCHVSKVA